LQRIPLLIKEKGLGDEVIQISKWCNKTHLTSILFPILIGTGSIGEEDGSARKDLRLLITCSVFPFS